MVEQSERRACAPYGKSSGKTLPLYELVWNDNKNDKLLTSPATLQSKKELLNILNYYVHHYITYTTMETCTSYIQSTANDVVLLSSAPTRLNNTVCTLC